MVFKGMPVEVAVTLSTALWPSGESEAAVDPVTVMLREKETMGVVCCEGAPVGRKLGRAVGAEGCTDGIAEGRVDG
jgi:hypothetical protein